MHRRGRALRGWGDITGSWQLFFFLSTFRGVFYRVRERIERNHDHGMSVTRFGDRGLDAGGGGVGRCTLRLGRVVSLPFLAAD